MKIRDNSPLQASAVAALKRLLCVLALVCAVCAPALSQQTAGGTVITNTATATYSDGSTTYNTQSLPVTVTVANVSGLNITPDGQTNATVVAGQTAVPFVFTVTNTGNFDDQVRFLSSGASIVISGPGTITDAFIDNVTVNNTRDGGELQIFGNGAAIDKTIKRSGDPLDHFNVVVLVNVNAGATSGQSIRVQLGNETGASPYDNLASTGAGSEVRTIGASANGSRQAGGDSHADIANDAQLQVSLSAPVGPIALGSDISYTVGVCNTGARDAAAITLSGNSGVFIIMPVPSNT